MVYQFLTSVALLALNGWCSTTIHGSEEDLFTSATQIHNKMCPLRQKRWSEGVIFGENEFPDFITNNYGERTTPGFVTNEYGDKILYNPGDCCGYCEKTENCVEYGMCCLDQYGSFDSAQMATEQAGFRCIKPEYMTSSQPAYPLPVVLQDTYKIWIKSECTGDVDVNDINTKRCTSPDFTAFLDYLVPVSVLKTNITYKNRYCSYCNGVKESNELLNWDIEFICNGSLTLTDDKLYDKLKKLNCSLFFAPPADVSVEECEVPEYSIAECNATGWWPYYETAIEKACHAFIDPFNRTYQNYFCYVCNTDQPVPRKHWNCLTELQPWEEVMPPFVALINLEAVKEWQNDESLQCNLIYQFSNKKKMVCRDLHCHEGLQVVSRKRCERLLKDQHYMHDSQCNLIEVFMKLTPRDSNILTDLSQYGGNVTNSVLEEATKRIPNILKLQTFEKEKYVQDDLETGYIAVYWTMYVDYNYWFDPLADILKLFHNTEVSIKVKGSSQTFRSEVVSSFIKSDAGIMTSYSKELQSIIKYTLSPIFLINYPDPILENDCARREYNKLLICPFIKIGVNELSFKRDEGFLIIEDTSPRTILAGWQYELINDTLHVCLDDFQVISDDSKHWYSPTKREHIQEIISASQILSFACVCISLFCLLVTIGRYAITPKLRTQPGINNMILCISLLLAQTFYQFGAGQTAHVSSFACSVIGATCHFLWLCVMFSMNNCSIQMFKIFKSSVLVAPRFSWTSTGKSVVYVVCTSLTFVMIGLAISLSLSNGKSSGYGGSLCYLSDYLLHILTFMIPTALTITVNIVLFGYVVVVINKSTQDAARLHQERNYFGVYIRLSTLTGLTWIFGYLYLFLKLDVIEYLFIVFNGLQGVFLMLAFAVKAKHCSKLCQHMRLSRNANKKHMILNLPTKSR